ncbi:MAG TPA: glutathione-disulfide reductase [Polyangiaceae bacterium]|nr:glutathione-disulfide reductase [Polyangiaceae bacterium]
MTAFDYIVIGGGSGGIASARRAAAHGAKVVLVERAHLGGTCVNVGCVPKKIMWTAANVAKTLHVASDFGFGVGTACRAPTDWALLKQKRDAAVQHLRGLYEKGLSTAGVHTLRGTARLIGPHLVEVDGVQYSAPHILIATGSRPQRPSIAGAELGSTSDDFFALSQQPKDVAIVGSGYIAAEIASTLLALGSRVTMLVRGQSLLSHFDGLLGPALADELQKDGATLRFATSVTALDRGDMQGRGTDPARALSAVEGSRACRAHLNSRETAEFDWLLWATGRVPVTEGLGLSTVGMEFDGFGKIRVDRQQNTSLSGVYAVGDVAQGEMLTPVAIAAGRKLADRLFGGQPASQFDHENIPTVVFSHPPIGTVGLSEAEAVSRHGVGAIRVYESRFTNLFYALCEDRRPTHIKLVTRLPEERILGVHVIGLGADELIQGFAVAVKMGATKADFDRTVAIHPTAAEELVTMTKHRPGRLG